MEVSRVQSEKQISLCQPETRRPAHGLTALLIALALLFSFSFPPAAVTLANTPPDGAPINKIGYTNSSNGSALRSLPRITSSTLITYLSQGTRVEVFTRVTGDSSSGSNQWYYVRDVLRNRYGYVHASLISLTNTPINQEPPEPNPDFEAYLTQQGFPESYKPALRILHANYPNWVFTAFHIVDQDSPVNNRQPLLFQKALHEENVRRSNMVTKTSLLSHRSYEKADYDYKTDTWVVRDAGGWMTASRDILAYSLDARNFLTEQQVFQFEQLTYLPGVHQVEAVQAAIAGSFMDGKSVTFTDLEGVQQTMTYPEIFMDAAERTGVNPFFLAQRCLTEVGRNGSDSVSGTVSGYVGYYNFYNIGATAGASPITNGLRYARYGSSGSGPSATEQERYLLPWNSQWRAIVGGANWIGRGYILEGQDTSYSQKFNLDGDTAGTYWHQYMGNVYAPANEASRVYNMYLTQGLLDSAFVFRIPVLAEMPASPAPYPSDNLSRNNWLKSITLSNGTLSPAFNPEVYSYTATVEGQVSQITLGASSYHTKCTIRNTGQKSLAEGDNTFVIEALSEKGEVRAYTVAITRQATGPTQPTQPTQPTEPEPTEPEPTEPGPTDPPPLTINPANSYKLMGDYIHNAWPASGRNKTSAILAALNLPAGYTASATDSSGKPAAADTLLGTGAMIHIYEGSSTTPLRTLQLLIYGDANGDGKFNSVDLSYVIDTMVRNKSWSPVQNSAIDVNRDGKVNSVDLSYIIDAMVRGQTIKQD